MFLRLKSQQAVVKVQRAAPKCAAYFVTGPNLNRFAVRKRFIHRRSRGFHIFALKHRL